MNMPNAKLSYPEHGLRLELALDGKGGGRGKVTRRG